MHRLVALDLPAGPAFVDALRRTWDDGDAVLPVDRRLPPAARDRLLAAARPHAVATEGGTVPLDGRAPPVETGDALVIASSGTTGEPKLVVHTLDGLAAHARAVHEHLAVTSADRWLACLPLAHIGGLGVVLRSVLTGTGLDVLDGFDAAAVAAAPERFGSTLVSLVPTALDRVAADRFRWVVLGGSGDRRDRPANVVRTYGLTETGGGVVYGDHLLPGVEVRVDEGGAILLRGPMLARGLRGPDGAVAPITGPDGWLRTGDLGRLDPGDPGEHDEHGNPGGHGASGNPGGQGGHGPRLVVDGRADDLIVTGGQNVWPEPVEAAIATVAGVVEAAVFGRDDPEWGQRVVAAVVVDGDAPTLAEVRDRVREVLPAYAAPKELLVLDALPRTALGKVRRRHLAARAPGPP